MNRFTCKSLIEFCLIAVTVVLFIIFRWYIVDLIWKGRLTPPEPDDSFGYIAHIRIVGDTGSCLYDLKYIWSWNKNDLLTFLPWKISLGIVKLFTYFSYVDVYKANFYFGIILMIFPILYTAKVLEKDKLFWIFAISFLALFNGGGGYHGFFWVVPSFYSVVATFLLISLVLDMQGNSGMPKGRSFLLLFLIALWVVWSHPLGKFSIVAVVLSTIMCTVSNKIPSLGKPSSTSLKKTGIILIIGVTAILSFEVLPYTMGIVPYTYPSVMQLIHVESSGYEQFRANYLDYFSFNSYNTVLLVIGMFAALYNKKISLFSLYSSFFIVAFVSSILNELGYRMLVYLWPLTFLVYSYGCYFLMRKLINSGKANLDGKLKIKINIRRDVILLVLVITLISANYIYPFVRENYDWNIRFADNQRQRMFNWIVDRSIVDYLTNFTNPGDLIIFADSNAFFTITSLGLLDRETAYANWNWSGHYAFLKEKVKNGTCLIATRSPYREEILRSSLTEDVLNLKEAFNGRLTLVFIRNFGILSLYEVSLKEKEVPYVFEYREINAELIADDFQTEFWEKTNNIYLCDDNYTKVSGENALSVTLSQTRTGQNDFIFHIYEVPQNWSLKDLFVFDWYGCGSGKTIEIMIYAPDASNRFKFNFLDSSTGWKRIIIPLNDFEIVSGNPVWSNIKAIYFRFAIDSPYTEKFYLDKLFLDVAPKEEAEDIELRVNDFQILTQIVPLFFALLFVPGFMWTIFVFRVRDTLALIAISFGLSFSLIFLSMFFMNLATGIRISTTSTAFTLFAIVIFPSLLACFERLLKSHQSKNKSYINQEPAQ